MIDYIEELEEGERYIHFHDHDVSVALALFEGVGHCWCSFNDE